MDRGMKAKVSALKARATQLRNQQPHVTFAGVIFPLMDLYAQLARIGAVSATLELEDRRGGNNTKLSVDLIASSPCPDARWRPCPRASVRTPACPWTGCRPSAPPTPKRRWGYGTGSPWSWPRRSPRWPP